MACSWVWLVFVWTVSYCEHEKYFVLVFRCENVTVAGRTMARFIALAQARLTHPGETCRNRSRLYSNSCSGSKLLFWARPLRKGWPRSSEEGSPKRASANGNCSWMSSSRLGERSSPERESLSPEWDLFAWPRGWARMWLALLFLCSPMLALCLYWSYF